MNNEPRNLMQAIAYIGSQLPKQKLALIILTILGLNLGIYRGVYAATNTTLQIQFTWAYGILGAIILGLIFYLLIVVFQPERF